MEKANICLCYPSFKRVLTTSIAKRMIVFVLPVAHYSMAHAVTVVVISWSKNSICLIPVCEPVISHFISIYFFVFF